MNVKAKDMNFKNMESLKPVENVINEARKGIKDKTHVIVNSSIPEALGAADRITFGLAAAYAFVIGGMAAGVFFVFPPVAVLSVAGYATVSGIKRKNLIKKKNALFNELKDTLHDVQIALEREKADATEERREYLNSLIVLLESAMKSLRHDLGI